MSQFNLLDDAPNPSPLPNVPFHTMLLIETNNFLPVPLPSQPQIEQPPAVRPPPTPLLQD